MVRADELLGQAQMRDVAMKTSDLLLEGLKGHLLSVLLSQDFSGIFGAELFAALMTRISNEHFKEVNAYLTTLEEEAIKQSGPGSPRIHQIGVIRSRLLDTTRGRQFLALEKARSIIEAGETERRSKRIRAGLNAVLQGNTAILQNDEIAVHLPVTVQRLLANGKEQAAALLIENVAKELLKGDEKVRARLSRSLSYIGEILLQAGKWDWLEKLTGRSR